MGELRIDMETKEIFQLDKTNQERKNNSVRVYSNKVMGVIGQLFGFASKKVKLDDGKIIYVDKSSIVKWKDRESDGNTKTLLWGPAFHKIANVIIHNDIKNWPKVVKKPKDPSAIVKELNLQLERDFKTQEKERKKRQSNDELEFPKR